MFCWWFAAVPQGNHQHCARGGCKARASFGYCPRHQRTGDPHRHPESGQCNFLKIILTVTFSMLWIAHSRLLLYQWYHKMNRSKGRYRVHGFIQLHVVYCTWCLGEESDILLMASFGSMFCVQEKKLMASLSSMFYHQGMYTEICRDEGFIQ